MKKAMSILIAICIVFSLALYIPGDNAAASGTAAEMAAELRNKYGFNTSVSYEWMLEEILHILDLFPDGMIKEMTDGYRARGVTSSIRAGQWTSYDRVITWDDAACDAAAWDAEAWDMITGHISISSSNLIITLYMTYALVHEIGHAIDYYLGRLRGRAQLSSGLTGFNEGAAYGGEYIQDVFSTWYGATSGAEDFAEIVEHLFLSPEYVRNYMRENPNTPLTRKYNFVMEQIVAGFSSLESKESAFPLIFGIDVLLDGRPLTFEVPPRTINDRIMVPLREIFQALGAAVDWNADTQTVMATKDGVVVVLTIGSTSPTVNGSNVAIDQPGVVINGRTLAPLRFVAEAFGGTVDWNGATRTANISS